MSNNLEDVKKLRQQTGAGIVDCKEALTSNKNNFEKAVEWLRKKGLSRAAKKSGRQAGEGLVASYVHGQGRIGVLLEVNSETDFVARNKEFQNFVEDLTLHITAMQPLFVNKDEISEEVALKEKNICKEQAKQKAKKPEMVDRIAEGIYNKWLEEVCLLDQDFVRQEQQEKPQKVQEALQDLISKIGENIVIRRFVRYELGETTPEKKSDFAKEVQEMVKS